MSKGPSQALRASSPRGGAKKKELTCRSYVIMPGRGPVPVQELTDAEREQWHRSMLRRLSEAMSDYYTQHPEQYASL